MKCEKVKKTSIGGQALIEGIMMRGPEKTAMAVRNPEGEIVIESFPTAGKGRPRLFKLRYTRGFQFCGLDVDWIPLFDALGRDCGNGRGAEK